MGPGVQPLIAAIPARAYTGMTPNAEDSAWFAS
jgi:hypothetical protein